MRILVTYATRYGATAGIAERIGERLADSGHDVDVLAADVAVEAAVDDYDAYVVGSAAYMGHWLKPAMAFVSEHADTLSGAHTWLFSSGPLGEDELDEDGVDKRTSSVPEDVPIVEELLRPDGHRVFFGVVDPDKLKLRDRLVRKTPVGRKLLPEGDFRDWDEIDDWAARIAVEVEQPVRIPRKVT